MNLSNETITRLRIFLTQAVEKGNLELIKIINEELESVEFVQLNPNYMLVYASYLGKNDIVHYYLEKGIDANKKIRFITETTSALEEAVKKNLPETVRLLLSYDTSLSASRDVESIEDLTSNNEIKSLLREHIS